MTDITIHGQRHRFVPHPGIAMGDAPVVAATTKTRSEQRIEQLINVGRPLTESESGELYRALHADYMRKWRLENARRKQRVDPKVCHSGNQKRLKRVLAESVA